MTDGLPTRTQHQKSDEPELGRVVQGSAIVFVATAFGLGLNYLFSIWVARALGATEFGVYAIGLGVFNTLSVFALGGLDSATLKFIPGAQASRSAYRVRQTVRVLLGLSLLFGTAIGLALLIGAPFLARPLFKNEHVISVLMLFAIGIPAFTISSVLVTTMQALQDIVRSTMIRYVYEPIARNVIAIVLLWIGLRANGAALAVVVALILTALLAARVLRSNVAQGNDPSSSGVATTQILEFSSHLVLALLFSAFAARSDVLILGYYSPTEAVGIYSAAFQTSSIIILVLGSLESIANPLFSQHIAHANMMELEALYRTILRWSVIAALPLFLLMSLFPTVILAAFGSTYESGAATLVILALGQIVNAATASTHNVLVLAGHSKIVMWNGIGMGVLQIGLNFILIPRFGIIGAALAMTTSLVVVNVLRLAEARILLRLTSYDRKIWKPLAAAFASSLIALLAKPFLTGGALFALMGVVVANYYGMLLLLGLSEEDHIVLTQFQGKFRSYLGMSPS